MEHKRLRAFAGHTSLLVLLPMVLSSACGDKPGAAGTTAAGRRDVPVPIAKQECKGDGHTVDVNNDGKPDIRHVLAKGKRACTEIDMNFDAQIDVYRFYADDGKGVRFEQHDYDFDGRLDQQAFYVNGVMERKELDTNFDGLVDTWMWCKGPLVDRAERARRKPGRVDTWEAYADGQLAEIKYDENNDGKPEKWELFKDGALSEIRYDSNGDGQSDRNEAAVGVTDQKDKPISCDGTSLPQPAAPPSTLPAMPSETTGGAADGMGEPDPTAPAAVPAPPPAATDKPADAAKKPAAAGKKPAASSAKKPADAAKPATGTTTPEDPNKGEWQEGK